MEPDIAYKEKRTSMAGVGCLMQFAAFLAGPLVWALCSIVLGPLGSIVGFVLGCVVFVVLFHKGHERARVVTCSACGSRLPNPHVTKCRACQSVLLETRI